MRFWVAGGLGQVLARHGVKSWRAWPAQRVVPTSVRHVCLEVSAGKHCIERWKETYEAVRDVLLGEDGLDSESGDESSDKEGHCDGSAVGGRFGVVMSVGQGKGWRGPVFEADEKKRRREDWVGT